MTQLGDPKFARDLRQLVEQRAQQVAAGQALRRVWGVVTEVQEPDIAGRGGTATLLLGGSTTESRGVRWFQARPAVGETALVELPPPGGTRFIVALDREDVVSSVASSLDPAALDALTTDAELNSHQVTGGHLTPYFTHNTATADAGKWAAMGHGVADDQFDQFHCAVEISGGGLVAHPRGLLRFSVKQQADFGSQPDVMLELVNTPRNVAAADFVLLVTSVVGPTVMDLYCRVAATNTYLSWWPKTEDPHGLVWTWNVCPDWYGTTLPAGTQTVATT